MLLRVFIILIVLLAIIVGALALTLPREEIVKLIVFRDFFDVSLPILGFGALVKYLCTGICKHHHHTGHCHAPECGESEK